MCFGCSLYICTPGFTHKREYTLVPLEVQCIHERGFGGDDCVCVHACQCFVDIIGNILLHNVRWPGRYTIRHFLCFKLGIFWKKIHTET